MLAEIRGDDREAALLRRAGAIVQAQGLDSDSQLEPFLKAGPDRTSHLDRDVHRRLRHMYEAGAWVLLESAKADLPADLRWLLESDAVSIEQLARLHEGLGVTTAADLAYAIERRAIRSLPGFDAPIEHAIEGALPNLRASIPRIALGRAVALLEPILSCLRAHSSVAWAAPVGSLRRGQDMVGDIEVLAPADDPAAALEDVSHLPDVVRVLHRSARRIYLLLDRVQVGVRFPEPSRAGVNLLYLTGNPRHLRALEAAASARGGAIGFDGYHPPKGAPPVARQEEDIYEALGLPFIPPEIRQGEGEIEAACRGALPSFVSRKDIRGDLHMHTVWSDGRDETGAMVAACHALGYEYLAITDHSPHAVTAHSLTPDKLRRQADEIARLREAFPRLVILHGCEVDIRPDGRLDLPDRALDRLDIVLASLHDRAGQSAEQLLRRYSAAMRHPLVTVITHPTNRLLPHRPGYDLDYDRLIATAVETGTFLEIDGAPAHLDMDGALARRAIAGGVMVTIDSDAHRAEWLERQMQLGLTTARRGWVEPRHVVNARPIAELRALIARKRGRTS